MNKKCDLCNNDEWVVCDEFAHFLEYEFVHSKVKEDGSITPDTRGYKGDMFYCSGCQNVVNHEMLSLLDGSLVKVTTRKDLN